MSPRTKGPRNCASKLPVADDKPQFDQKKKKPQAQAQVSKEEKIARARILHEWSKGACYYFNPRELRSAPGANSKAEEPKILTCPHQGSDNIFDFVFCKPDCPGRTAADSVFSGRSLALCNIKDDSSSSDSVLSGRSLALCNIEDDSSSCSSDEETSSSSSSDEETIPADPYAPRPPQRDPTQCYLLDPPGFVW